MIIRNYLETPGEFSTCHDGEGAIKQVYLYRREDFDTRLRFINYCELEPGQSIGFHQHGQNEEVYVILSGAGHMQVNDEISAVSAGDVLLNKPGWSHGLVNDSDGRMTVLVFEADGVA